MEILQTAITAEGGVSKLARAIGTNPNVISNWHVRGVPKGWQKLLELKYGRIRARRVSRPETLQEAA